MAVEELGDQNFERVVLTERTIPMLVTFYAPKWSAPCKQMIPILDHVAEIMKGQLAVFVVDTDKSTIIRQQYDIRGVPTNIIFRDGERRATTVGSLPEYHFMKWVSSQLADDVILGVMLDGDTVRAVNLLRDGTYRLLDRANDSHGLLYRLPAEYLRLTRASRDLEAMINEGGLKEKHFQEFFEEYPEFLLDADHAFAHPHLVLEHHERNSLIPDFLLEPYDDRRLCDLLELKTPSSPIFRKSKRHGGFSSQVTRGIDQLFTYRDFFDDDARRGSVLRKHGLTAFRPRLFLIIGRRPSIDSVEFRRNRDKLNGVVLRTYDDVLDRMTMRMNRYRKG